MLRKASVTWSSRASLRSQGVSIRADWTLDPQQARTSRRFVRVRAGPPRAMPASASFCGPAWPPPRALTPPRLTRTASVQNHADAQICPCLETHRAAGARGDPRPCSPCPSRLRVVARALRPGPPGRTRPPFSSLARRVAFPSSPRPAPRARGGAGGRALPDRPSRLSLKACVGGSTPATRTAQARPRGPPASRCGAALRRVCGGAAPAPSAPSARSHHPAFLFRAPVGVVGPPGCFGCRPPLSLAGRGPGHLPGRWRVRSPRRLLSGQAAERLAAPGPHGACRCV